MPRTTDPLELLLPRVLGAAERRETHCSWVFLTEDRAYKLKKPVRFEFLDLSTAAARRRACEEEVRVNAELAGDVVIGVRGVLANGRLVRADDPAAVDFVVEMRRFDEQRTMAALAARGRLTINDAAAAGRRIATFHASARRVHDSHAAVRTAMRWARNAEELAGVAGPARSDALAALDRFARTFIVRRAPDLDARAADGLVRDGHGDLRADHVLLDGRVTIVDRLEFDAALRENDVADDLAFLLMDLEALGVRWAAEAVLAAYREAGGDAGDDGLIAFFSSYRALVRAKVELLRARQAGDDRARCEERADGLVRLAEHLAWRARPRPVILVCGPPASGKSSLAHALATRMRVPVLSSDAVRKELLGLAATDRARPAAYAHGGRERVYEELGRRLQAVPAGGGAIVDATFGDEALRAAFARGLDDLRRRRLLWIECSAPVPVLVARAAARPPSAARGSDAGPAVTARLAEAFEAPEEIPAGRRIRIDTTEGMDAALRKAGAWLDEGPAQDVATTIPRTRRAP
jgi:aminoglycoside phosphotransferase family enzyme/predicted kinase